MATINIGTVDRFVRLEIVNDDVSAVVVLTKAAAVTVGQRLMELFSAEVEMQTQVTVPDGPRQAPSGILQPGTDGA